MNKILENDHFYVFLSFIIFIFVLFKIIYPRAKRFLQSYSWEIQNKFLDFDRKGKKLNLQISQEEEKLGQINDETQKILDQADLKIQFYSLKIDQEIAEEIKSKLLFYGELKRKFFKKHSQDLISKTGEEIYKGFLKQWKDSSVCVRGHQKKVISSLNKLSCFEDL